MVNENFELADVTKDGSILMGKLVVCDGYTFDLNRTKAVFTHIHSDHIEKGFNKAKQRCQIFITLQTRKLLERLGNTSFDRRRQFHTVSPDDPKLLVKGEELPLDVLDENDPQMIGNGKYMERLELIPSSHMLGAASVLVTLDDGTKICYSGDFSSDDEPPKCDILIVDATHGSPQFNKKNTDVDSLQRQIVLLVEKKYLNSKPVTIHAHRGKLHEIMSLISSSRNIPENAKFFCSEEDARIAEVYRDFNYPIRELGTDRDDLEYQLSVDNAFIEFTSGTKPKNYEDSGRVYGISITGYLGEFDCIENDDKATFQISQHAQFDEIIEYVRKSQARQIIVENTRTDQGIKLENHLKNRGFNATCRPEPKFRQSS